MRQRLGCCVFDLAVHAWTHSAVARYDLRKSAYTEFVFLKTANMNQKLLQGTAAVALTAYMVMAVPASAQEIQSGFYFGGHIGGGAADLDGQFQRPGLMIDPDQLDLNGLAVGFHAGYNHITGLDAGGLGTILIGIEGDVTFTDWKDTANSPAALTTAGIRGVVDLLASVRARLGVTDENWLFYITGGVAFADAHAKAHYSGSIDKDELNDIGGVVGAGIEVALTDTISLRGEGLYYFFNESQSINSTPGSTPGLAGDFTRLDDAYVIRGGLSISLNGLLGGM